MMLNVPESYRVYQERVNTNYGPRHGEGLIDDPAGWLPFWSTDKAKIDITMPFPAKVKGLAV